MKLKNKFFTGAVRVFLISLVLSLGMVNPVRAVGEPDLTISSIADSGDFVQDGVGTYTITVTNIGGPTSGTITLDVYSFFNGVLTVGPESNKTVVLTATNITGPAGWNCVLDTPDIHTPTCATSTESLGVAGTAVFTLTVDVAADAPINVTIEADIAGGGEIDTMNNSASKVTTIGQKPDLTVTKTHTGSTPTPIGSGFDFVQSGVGTYTITVSNSNAYIPTDGSAITVTYALPTGLTVKTVSGSHWNCTVTPTCTRDADSLSLAPEGSFDPITLDVDVAWNAAESVVNTVTVSGGGEVNALNSTNSASTAIEQKPDLDITNVTLEPSTPFIGQDFILHVTGVNQGTATSGSIVSAYAFIDPDIANSTIWPVPCNWLGNNYTVYSSASLTDIAVGAGEPFTRDITIPGELAEGPHKIYIYTDPGCSIYESVETNNTYGPININVPTPVTISGNVGLAGVSLGYSVDEVAQTVVSNATGDYVIYVPKNWTGTITPVKAGNVFSPPSKSYSNLTVNQTQNFITRPGFASVGTLDGWILESSENSNQGGMMNAATGALLLGDNGAKRQYLSILSFNTASLPDNAVITNITLRVRRGTIGGGGNPLTMLGGFMVDVRKGLFGTSASLQLTDFMYPRHITVGPSIPAFTSGWYFINLTTAKNFVNKLGNTQMRLRFRIDDNNNAIANYMSLYSGNVASYSPMLFVQYTLP